MSGLRAEKLNGTWRFKPGDGEWTTIEVPSLWEAAGHLDLDGLVIYERDVELESPDFATLEFGAVADICKVFVNGQEAGTHEVGFTPFHFDVTSLATSGKNVIRVEVGDPAEGTSQHLETVQGKQGWANRFFESPPSLYLTYGGIWQPCRLLTHGPVYISDLWCDMSPDGPAVGVTLENRSEEDLAVPITIRAFGQKQNISIEVAERSRASGTTRFSGRELDAWSPASPKLYEVGASAEVTGKLSHVRALSTGVRTFERRGDDFYLNGSPYRMRSALHQGFWPRGLYSLDPELSERDVFLALEAGFNTLRTHLKAFEPRWLDEADRQGLLLHCDLPIGEPLNDEALVADSDFARRCVTAALEQVRRDRSRPSILMWTLMNEVGLRREDLLRTPGYRQFAERLADAVKDLDPSRPTIENDWVADPDLLYTFDVRSPHWYGRANTTFLKELDSNLADSSNKRGPLFVTEFGEWRLPTTENGAEFWDNEMDLSDLAKEAGWRGDFDSFAEATQVHQGWADRIHAERLRGSQHVLGYCLTEWTDVPLELNGLVSLRRNPKDAAIEAFRPAQAEVAPIAFLDRYAFAPGESAQLRLCLSNWSVDDLPRSKLTVEV